MFVEKLLHLRVLGSGNVLSALVKGISDRLSLSSSSFTISVIHSKHVIVRPSVHLDWEYCGLIWKSLEAHLVDPWRKIKALNWWDSIQLLFLSDNIVVLAWRVKTQKHSLST